MVAVAVLPPSTSIISSALLTFAAESNIHDALRQGRVLEARRIGKGRFSRCRLWLLLVSFNAHTRVLRIKNMPTELHDVHQRWAIAAVGEWPLDGLLNRDEVRLFVVVLARPSCLQCLNCNAPFADDAQLIELALHDTTTDVHLDHDPFWVEAFSHPGMSYQCVVAHIMQIARATFGQEPVVTEVQVIADGFQWTAEMNHPVIIQGVERFCIFIFCTFTAPVRGM
ncbi:uncharacterized protein Aud_005906 [Aspergillus udagawae]|uniref:Uncharacterized protein n=1 Tax=Aspergillus udagawae TaxID=91492 RepID=A0A8E0UXI0_9EURO|nr:uncharacterized protein Aud_005906 [Aspergillus udagawae]GIC89487.1 hypothetical protein Aud_005906 [Aspergillus udagawae]